MGDRQTHGFPSFFDSESEILILGSFPSVKSREEGFYYGHPQNRFYKVLSSCFNEPLPIGIEDKKAFLAKHHIALSDSIGECVIVGSSDVSIKQAVPMDLRPIFKEGKIKKILLNGKTAEKFFYKFQKIDKSIPCITMPSTSAANAAWSLEKLIEIYRAALLG